MTRDQPCPLGQGHRPDNVSAHDPGHSKEVDATSPDRHDTPESIIAPYPALVTYVREIEKPGIPYIDQSYLLYRAYQEHGLQVVDQKLREYWDAKRSAKRYRFTFGDDDNFLKREVTVVAPTEDEARRLSWTMLSDEEKDACGTWDCFDVQPVLST